MKVGDHLFRDLTAVFAGDSVRSLITVMSLTHLTAVPVVNEKNEYVGCVAEVDIVRACMPDYVGRLTSSAFLPESDRWRRNLQRLVDCAVSEIMPPDYPSVHPDDTVSHAADLMSRTGRSVLPVVEATRLIGRLGRMDLLRLSLEEP